MGKWVLQKSQGGKFPTQRAPVCRALPIDHHVSGPEFRLPLLTSGYRRESVERPNAQHKQVRKPANAANLSIPQFGWRLHLKWEGLHKKKRADNQSARRRFVAHYRSTTTSAVRSSGYR